MSTNAKTIVKNPIENAIKSVAHSMAEVREGLVNLDLQITDFKVGLIKWMFIIWILQLASYIFIVKFFFH